MSLVFSEGSLSETPDGTVVLKFPGFKLTLMVAGDRVYAEILRGSRRTTYVGGYVDDGLELEKAKKKVLENIWRIVKIDHKK